MTIDCICSYIRSTELELRTHEHDYTSSQEVPYRYYVHTYVLLVVTVFHSPTLRGHECESLMHPDDAC